MMAVWNVIDLADFLDFRFDAECYQPELLEVEQLVQNLRPVALDTIATVSDGNHLSIAGEFCESGVRYLKGQELSDFFIADKNPTYIPDATYESLTRAHIRERDVLLSVIGTVGPVSLVTDKYEKLCGSCKLAIIRPHSINSSILAAYLSSEIGQTLLRRRVRGSVQPGVILPDIKSFPVPPFKDALVEQVDRLIEEARIDLKRAESYYPEAETEMLGRMGWNKITAVPLELCYTLNFDELEKTGRSDPEFFHPHYARLRAQIKNRGSVMLDSICEPITRGVQPEFDLNGNVLALDSKSVRPQGVEPAEGERVSQEFYDRRTTTTARVRYNDVLLNSTGRGTLGRAACYLRSEPAMCDNHIAILRPDQSKCLPVYLALFLNSPAGLAQSEQFQTGSSGQLELYPNQIAQFEVFVPRKANGKIDLAWQQSLADKVLESSRVKERAREKLEEAKRLVGEAITH